MEGIHIFGKFINCKRTDFLLNKKKLEKEITNAINKSGLTALGGYFYKFRKGGVTGMVLLAESHVAIHTWPELNNSLTIDVYTCNYSENNDDKAKLVFEILASRFVPKRIKKKIVKD
jgi:S-adenosylmethionine decarboxylase proenzyme